MKQLLFAFALLLCHCGFAQNKKALIIGIDVYKPENIMATNTNRTTWNNLDGCVNDATAMKDLVMARYGFPGEQVTLLLNGEASRARILSELKRLVETARKGEVVFIYYAGHGSQVYNSLSVEKDKKDETMVPADAYLGVPDIRDKELAMYFNQLLDKGVLLTVIFDSCHSGSVGRGLHDDLPKVRYIEESTADAKDASNPERPESRGALILSAAQDFEFAKEQRDENDVPHGAFTIALLKALQQLSPDASVSNIYTALTSIMKFYGKTQEPVLAGNEQRRNGTLFGLEKGAVKNQLVIGVSRINAKGVELQGGYAFGLSEGVKLAGRQGKDTLEIIEMRGANKSFAKVLNGNSSQIAPGSLFEVVSWASAKAPALKIYIPKSGLEEKQLKEAVQSYNAAKASRKNAFIWDIAKVQPEKVIFYSDGKWNINDSRKSARTTMSGFSTASLTTGTASGPLFVNFPPSEMLVAELMKSFEQYSNVQVVHHPAESQYALVGTVDESGQLAYGLVKSMVTMQDTTETLPARTDFERYAGTTAGIGSVAEKLSEYAFRLAKIRDWLMLTSPGGGPNRFPFKLSFQEYTSGQPLKSDRVRVNDTLSLYMELDKTMGEWNRKMRYVYVFSIDSKGSMNLLFPYVESGNLENRLPVTNASGVMEERTHIADILITPPAGADHYFMLSSEEAISNLSAFQQEGVLTRGPGMETKNPLEDLLFTGTKTRNKVITPVNWSIYKLVIRTTE